MKDRTLFWETFGMLAWFGFLNFIATEYHLYWSLDEFDSVVHFFAGTFLAFFFIWLYFYSGFLSPSNRNFKQFLKVAALGLLVGGVLWEAFELMIGEAKYSGVNYPYDTTLDFIMDTLGAAAGLLYAYTKEIDFKVRHILK